MTPTEINKAIAEIVGWQHAVVTHENPIERGGYRLPNWGSKPIEAWWIDGDDNRKGAYISPPNYYDDLNACAEMESLIFAAPSSSRVVVYTCWIQELTKDKPGWHATAPQRCEAFLRTFNKWKSE